MKRIGNWWNLVSVVLATLLLLVALGMQFDDADQVPVNLQPGSHGDGVESLAQATRCFSRGLIETSRR